MSVLTIRDVDYYVEEHGAGTPLVLLHGFTGSSQNWDVNSLAQQHTVITLDILGHGNTSKPQDWQRYTMPEVACDLYTLLSALVAAPVTLLGYSMGGRLALYFAAHFPQMVRHLILESASPGLKTEVERAARRQSDNELADFIECEGIPAFVDRWERVPLFDSQKTLPEAIRAKLRQQRLTNDPTGLANSLRGMGTGMQPSVWEALPGLPMSVTLITGELDHKFVNIGREMAGLIPHAEHHIISGAGHTTHLEQPQRFRQRVLA